MAAAVDVMAGCVKSMYMYIYIYTYVYTLYTYYEEDLFLKEGFHQDSAMWCYMIRTLLRKYRDVITVTEPV